MRCVVLPAHQQVEHITRIVAAALDDVQGVGADRIGRQVQPHLLLQRGHRAGAGDPGAAKGVVVAAEQGGARLMPRLLAKYSVHTGPLL
jgi:hypothetical protein